MARPRAAKPTYRLVLRGNRFYVRWWQDGAWQRVSAGTEDRDTAQVFLDQYTAGIANPGPPPAPTISAILDGYLADRKETVASYDTLRHAAAALRRHLGNLQPDHMTRERSRFYASRRRAEGHMVGKAGKQRQKPTGNGTIIRELVTLRAALKWAHSERWITYLPTIDVPKAPPPRDRWLSHEEAMRLLASAKVPHIRLFLALALYTAGRAGAILQLRWSAVDLGRRLIDLGDGAGNKHRAIVPINDELLPLLTEAKAGATCEHVIEHGGQAVERVVTGTRTAARLAKLPGVTPHTLRHTAATWMAQAGVPMVEIARFLGHTSTGSTERVYAKHGPDYLRRAAAALSGPSGTGNPGAKTLLRG